MVINYKKEVIKPDGRKLTRGGPRDQQRRVQESKDQKLLITALRYEIEQLQRNEITKPVVGKDLFTGEQVDDEIRKAVTESVAKKEVEKVKLISEIGALTKLIKEKDKSLKIERERVAQLMAQLSVAGKEGVIYEDPERPKIERTFIDPLEKDIDDYLVPHIVSEEIKTVEEDNIYSSIDKLKGLMGKLPNNN